MAAKLTLLSKEDVRMAIRRRGNEIAAKMTDQELFTSTEFATYAGRLADFILRKHRLYNLDIQFITDPDAYVAYTDGQKIVLNAGNVIAQFPKLLERRFKTNMGILFHECAHKLFLDFDINGKILDQIASGTLYGNFVTDGDPALEQAKTELETVTSSPYSKAIAKVYATLCNIIDDGHDEAAMKRSFPGFIATCIETASEVQMESSDSLCDAISARRDSFSIYCSLILQYAKTGYYKIGDDPQVAEPYIEFANSLEPIIDAALEIDDLAERWDQLNSIVLRLWPFLREKFPEDPQQQSGSSQGSSGQGGASGQGGGTGGSQQEEEEETPSSPTPEEVAAAIQQIMQEVQEATNSAPVPTNCSGNAISLQGVQNGGMDPGASGDLEDLKSQISTPMATAQIQSEMDQAQMEALRNSNVPLIHKHTPLRTIRHNPTNKQKYMRIASEVDPLVRNLVKEMKAVLRELNEEAIQHHRRIGPIVEATEAYRPDGKFFAKRKMPEDLPNMAMCILIDQSGSMYGEKLKCAIRTAIMLERFATSLDIPVMIAGHDVEYDVNLRIFTDFASATDNEDRWSLAGIEDGGCNRDGLPIHLCCDLLAARPEKVKLMVVISDGAPNDDGYRGKEARDDIRKIVNGFRRKGLLIYGAAIDKDEQVIKDIYGQGFLSIQNLAILPKTLVRLIRQQII